MNSDKGYSRLPHHHFKIGLGEVRHLLGCHPRSQDYLEIGFLTLAHCLKKLKF